MAATISAASLLGLAAMSGDGAATATGHTPAGGTTIRASVSSTGAQSNDASLEPAVSADGRFVAFMSVASNLVPGLTSHLMRVFVRDLSTGSVQLVSLSSDGNQANGQSREPSISADGRFVAFTSNATNLVPGDTNGSDDVFVRDLWTGTTQRASVSTDGTQAEGFSGLPSLSADGRFVVFESNAANLVPGPAEAIDVYLRDLSRGTTRRVSVSSDGHRGNSLSVRGVISADGRHVAFSSLASNLVPGDTNGRADVFVWDSITSQTQRVSVGTGGVQATGDIGTPCFAISSTGRYVAFDSVAANLVPGDTNRRLDVFVRDRRTGVTSRVSVNSAGHQAHNSSQCPAISAHGRYVAFYSRAANLVPGDTNGSVDVFVRDRPARLTRRVSVTSGGAQGQSNSLVGVTVAISGDGRLVAFSSDMSLVANDTNEVLDIFVHAQF